MAPRIRLPGLNYADPDLVFFTTIRAHPGRVPFADAGVASAVIDSLTWLRQHRDVRLYAYCLMPDHLHLLLQLGGDGTTLGTLIGSMKSHTTREWWRQGATGMLWQERFYERTVRKSEDAAAFVTYILQNPVRRGLVLEASAYRLSGTPDPMYETQRTKIQPP